MFRYLNIQANVTASFTFDQKSYHIVKQIFPQSFMFTLNSLISSRQSIFLCCALPKERLCPYICIYQRLAGVSRAVRSDQWGYVDRWMGLSRNNISYIFLHEYTHVCHFNSNYGWILMFKLDIRCCPVGFYQFHKLKH